MWSITIDGGGGHGVAGNPPHDRWLLRLRTETPSSSWLARIPSSTSSWYNLRLTSPFFLLFCCLHNYSLDQFICASSHHAGLNPKWNDLVQAQNRRIIFPLIHI
jgi:hypothetical protein